MYLYGAYLWSPRSSSLSIDPSPLSLKGALRIPNICSKSKSLRMKIKPRFFLDLYLSISSDRIRTQHLQAQVRIQLLHLLSTNHRIRKGQRDKDNLRHYNISVQLCTSTPTWLTLLFLDCYPQFKTLSVMRLNFR